GIDTSWARFKSLALDAAARSALDSLSTVQSAVMRAVDLMDPSKLVAPLAAYVRLTTRAANALRCTILEPFNTEPPSCQGATGDLAAALQTTRERASAALLDAAAVTVEATAPRELVAERDTLPVTLSVYNEGRIPVAFERATISGQRGAPAQTEMTILPDSVLRQSLTYRAGFNP